MTRSRPGLYRALIVLAVLTTCTALAAALGGVH